MPLNKHTCTWTQIHTGIHMYRNISYDSLCYKNTFVDSLRFWFTYSDVASKKTLKSRPRMSPSFKKGNMCTPTHLGVRWKKYSVILGHANCFLHSTPTGAEHWKMDSNFLTSRFMFYSMFRKASLVMGFCFLFVFQSLLKHAHSLNKTLSKATKLVPKPRDPRILSQGIPVAVSL